MLRGIAIALACFLLLPTMAAIAGDPVGRDRQTSAIDQLKQSIAAEALPARKLALVAQAVRAEADPNFRRRLLSIAETLAVAEQETFYTDLLATDPDAGLRSDAAAALGRVGSEKALAPLARAAASDPTTREMRGDVGGQSSARRAAIFAIAELAQRHPAIAADAAAKLRSLPENDPPPDNQGLADARVQAMYQITRDDKLLKPFFDRLKSDSPRERESGVIAFRYLKLKDVPPELVAGAKDPDVGVRQWAALTLGEIGDAKVVPTLMDLAADPKEDVGVRCNALFSLGLLRTPAATVLTEKLLSDPDQRLQSSAAIALYRITGKKVRQFPPGYNAEAPRTP